MRKQKRVDSFDSIKIIGDHKFIKHTKKALRLLRHKSPGTYRNLVLRHIRCIMLSKYSKLYLDGKFKASSKTAYRSLHWFASAIVHEAYHLELEARGLSYGDTKEELKCISVQIRVGKRIGLSKYELNYLKHLDGKHWKLPMTW